MLISWIIQLVNIVIYTVLIIALYKLVRYFSCKNRKQTQDTITNTKTDLTGACKIDSLEEQSKELFKRVTALEEAKERAKKMD